MPRTTRRIIIASGICAALVAGGFWRLDPASFSLLLVGFVLLVGGAETLVRGAVSISRRLGISSMVIGLTVVAFGTSAPELAAGIQAVLSDKPEINLGNIVGSNIANVGLILGLTAMVYPISTKLLVLRREVPFMILVTLLGFLAMYDGVVRRAEGIVLIALLLAFVYACYRLDGTGKDARPEKVAIGPAWVGPVQVLAGLAGLTFGAQFLVDATQAIALDLGVSPVVVSLTLVAFGTSLPELATCLVASFRRQPDLVVGNVIGSNIFNLLFVLGVTSTIRPLDVPASIIGRDGLVMIGFAIVCLPMMMTRGKLTRIEGLLLFVCYLAYTAVVFAFAK
jgi:cation:H+ antiporter